MKQSEFINTSEYIKVLVPSETYDFNMDKRLLIPFDRGGSIGFVNQEGKVIVIPKYNMYHGECFKETDYIEVAKYYLYGTPINKKKIDKNLHSLWGVINFKGEEILPLNYISIKQAVGNNNLFTVEKTNHQWGVLTLQGQEVVPFGTYTWISGFDNGLAKVKGKVSLDGTIKERWGIIDETGKIILPLEYENIWNFYKKNYPSVPMFKNGKEERFKLK